MDTLEKIYVINVQLIWNFLFESVTATYLQDIKTADIKQGYTARISYDNGLLKLACLWNRVQLALNQKKKEPFFVTK